MNDKIYFKYTKQNDDGAFMVHDFLVIGLQQFELVHTFYKIYFKKLCC